MDHTYTGRVPEQLRRDASKGAEHVARTEGRPIQRQSMVPIFELWNGHRRDQEAFSSTDRIRFR